MLPPEQQVEIRSLAAPQKHVLYFYTVQRADVVATLEANPLRLVSLTR